MTTAYPMTCSAMLAALEQGATTALALCDDAIARIEADPELNIVAVRDFDRARLQAQQADAARARGERRPLLGIPMTVKESFNIEGLPTTWGYPFNARFRATQDALAVARLKAGGAVILGKTNVALGLGDYESNNPVYGRTLNPRDRSRSPGGSSGGSAAALAAGLVPLELGSDIGGSLRVPAHFCGVFAHKPTHGLLPGRGHDFPNHVAAQDPLSVIGPMARSAGDLELALRVLADDGAEGGRPLLPAPGADGTRSVRVLALHTHPACATSKETQAAVDTAAQRLAKRGATVSDTSPLLPDLQEIHTDYVKILLTLTSRGKPGAVSPLTAHEWLHLLDRRIRWQQRWEKLFEQFDAVIAPVFGCEAFAHLDAPDWETTTLDIDGEKTLYRNQLAWSGLATLAGLPATVAPVAASAQGLPLGVQIIGPLHGDLATIRVASWLE